MKLKEDVIFWVTIRNEKKLATLSNVSTNQDYKENLVEMNGKYYSIWNPHMSKLAAAIINGMEIFPILKKTKILYVDPDAEKTVKHISNIVGNNGNQRKCASGSSSGLSTRLRMVQGVSRASLDRNSQPANADTLQGIDARRSRGGTGPPGLPNPGFPLRSQVLPGLTKPPQIVDVEGQIPANLFFGSRRHT